MWILFEKIGNFEANLEKQVKFRTTMIFPEVAFDILKFFLINLSPTEVDCYVFVLVIFL